MWKYCLNVEKYIYNSDSSRNSVKYEWKRIKGQMKDMNEEQRAKNK